MERAEILAALRERGVTKIFAEYDGDGDDGMITGIQAEPTSSTPEPRLEAPLVDTVLALLYKFLGDRFAGWQDGIGSRGEFVWTMEDDKLRLRHEWRVIEYDGQKEVEL